MTPICHDHEKTVLANLVTFRSDLITYLTVPFALNTEVLFNIL